MTLEIKNYYPCLTLIFLFILLQTNSVNNLNDIMHMLRPLNYRDSHDSSFLSDVLYNDNFCVLYLAIPENQGI